MAMGGEKVSIFPGTSRELSFTAKRIDGYSGPIEIYAEGMPAGFSASLPTEIQADQQQAFVAVIADESATQPSDEAIRAIKFFGRAEINGQQVVHEIGSLQNSSCRKNPRSVSPSIQLIRNSPVNGNTYRNSRCTPEKPPVRSFGHKEMSSMAILNLAMKQPVETCPMESSSTTSA